MDRISLRKICREMLRKREHRLRVVPDVRIVAGFLTSEVADDDRNAAGVARRPEQLVDPWVVVDSVVDDDLRAGDGTRDGRADFEEMRVLIRIVKHARHRDVLTADLLRDVAVEVLGCENSYREGEREHQRPNLKPA